jgi:hypothetical protein
MALHGSTSFITRSLTFGWNRGRHGLAAPSTAAILSPFCYRCPVGKSFPSCDVQCLASSMELADANLTGKPAAMIIEPVMSAGGIVVPPPGYVKLLKQYCRERGMLLIMDESQTGLGKTGKMWGHLHEDVVPDIMTVSKHFGAGLPISAVCTTAEIAERAVENGYFATRSHACDPIACAAGVASIDIVIDEKLCERAAAIEARIKAALAAMAQRYDFIGDVRGRGVLLGIELVEDGPTREPANEMCREAVRQCEAKGLLVQPAAVTPARTSSGWFRPWSAPTPRSTRGWRSSTMCSPRLAAPAPEQGTSPRNSRRLLFSRATLGWMKSTTPSKVRPGKETAVARDRSPGRTKPRSPSATSAISHTVERRPSCRAVRRRRSASRRPPAFTARARRSPASWRSRCPLRNRPAASDWDSRCRPSVTSARTEVFGVPLSGKSCSTSWRSNRDRIHDRPRQVR